MCLFGDAVGIRRSGRLFGKTLRLAALPVGLFAFAGASRADVITDVNNELLDIIQNTSPALIDGPPNVAREIAMVDGAMYVSTENGTSPLKLANCFRGER